MCDNMAQILGLCCSLTALSISWCCLDSMSVSVLCKILPPSIRRLNVAGCRKTMNDNSK